MIEALPDIETFADSDHVTVRPKGDLLQNQVEQVELILAQWLDQGYYHFIVDFSLSKNVSSSVLGLIVEYKKQVKEAHGDIKLIVQSAKVQQLLKTTMLNRVFEVYESRNEVLPPH